MNVRYRSPGSRVTKQVHCKLIHWSNVDSPVPFPSLEYYGGHWGNRLNWRCLNCWDHWLLGLVGVVVDVIFFFLVFVRSNLYCSS